ncbi:hypothetical protein ACU4GH_25670 [Bradyrhizobium betae]
MNLSVSIDAYDAALNVPDFAKQNRCADVLLVLALHKDTGAAHTFALDGISYFDNNTGTIVDAGEIPSIFSAFKVVQALQVRKALPVDESSS